LVGISELASSLSLIRGMHSDAAITAAHVTPRMIPGWLTENRSSHNFAVEFDILYSY
jgi:hypothetical protein